MVLKSNVSSTVRRCYKFLLVTLIGVGEFGKYVMFHNRSQNLPSLQPESSERINH